MADPLRGTARLAAYLKGPTGVYAAALRGYVDMEAAVSALLAVCPRERVSRALEEARFRATSDPCCGSTAEAAREVTRELMVYGEWVETPRA